jgi:amino acid transporter
MPQRSTLVDPPTGPRAPGPDLERGLGLVQSAALNIANMVGIGPFITIPLFIAAMGGPQAMIAWVVAAVLVLCDGLVWSELGAALPGSGGSYHFLKQTFGRYRWGRIVPFLFIWQFLISGTLELASGYIGMVDYVKYALPGMEPAFQRWGIPRGTGVVGALLVGLITLLLCRRIRTVGWMAVAMCAGTLLTVMIVIASGLAHFDRSLLTMPPGAFHINWAWVLGLGAAMRIAVYDYLGYFNVCHLGDEVKNPGKTIPRAVILSVVIVAALYLTMNVAILGVVPWREAMRSENIAALFMERLFGRNVAVAFTGLIVWTALACLFAATLAYSRIPYAAARDGDFFRVFARVHPRKAYPTVALFALSGLTAAFCFLSLELVINAAVSVRILVEFIGQILALHILRTRRPDVPLPFRMWLYPLPSLLALVGWLFMFVTSGRVVLLAGLVVIVSGVIVFFIRQWVAPSPPPPEAAGARLFPPA